MRSHTATILAVCMAAALAPGQDLEAQRTQTIEAERASELRLYMRALAREFGTTGRELEILQGWVNHPSELPVLLFVADRAGVTTDVVGSLRNSGQSWQRIALRFGLGPATFRVPVGNATAEGVLARPVREFTRPAGDWHQIAMTDLEITALVNLRVLSHQLDVPPDELLPEVRGHSPDFVAAFARLSTARAHEGPPPS